MILLKLKNLAAMVFLSGLLASANMAYAVQPIPDFAAIKDVKQKKKAFFEFMYPFVEQADKAVWQDRQWIMQQNPDRPADTKRWLQLVEDYGVETKGRNAKQIKAALLKRVDIIPPSLALAQAANESAWGTSRFARLGNNFFGQWCFTKGCGIVPSRRGKGEIHEVRKFNSPLESVKAYIHNLNTQHTYQPLREIRAKLRAEGKFPSSLELAKGLVNYSARKHAYVKELQHMIRYNKLEAYDKKLQQAL